MRIDYKVTDEYNGKKVLHVLKNQMKLSGRLIKRLKLSNGILLNDTPIRTVDLMHAGDLVSVIINFIEEVEIEPEDSKLSIIYEDECFLAVNKPPHMPVHPTARHTTGTLAHAVLAYFNKQGLFIKARPINRLDKDTSGIVLFAKNSHMQDQIIRQMKEDKVLRIYVGVVHGVFDPIEGVINLPIARKNSSIIERIISPIGDFALTRYKTLEIHDDLSLVQFILETGRTHQIRVHARAMGHPILGDWLYSNIQTDLIGRQALHSHIFGFEHPITGERIELIAPIPEDIQKVLSQCYPLP